MSLEGGGGDFGLAAMRLNSDWIHLDWSFCCLSGLRPVATRQGIEARSTGFFEVGVSGAGTERDLDLLWT